MERINDTDIRIAYEKRDYHKLLLAIEKDMKKMMIRAKKEVFDDIEKTSKSVPDMKFYKELKSRHLPTPNGEA